MKKKLCHQQKFSGGFCGRHCWEDDKYCLFHSPNIKKKKSFFQEALNNEINEQLKNKKDRHLDFSYFIFPDKISIDSKILQDKNLIFEGAEFHGYIDCDFEQFNKKITMNFRNSVFHKGLGFNWEEINPNMDFQEATINGMYFDETTFYGKVNFSNVKFKDKIHIDFTRFEQNVSFSEAIFYKAFNFARSRILDSANFDKAEFKDEASFSFNNIPKKFTLNGTKFKNDVSLPDFLFDESVEVEMIDTYFFDEEWFTEKLEEKYFKRQIHCIKKKMYKIFNINITEVLSEKIQPNFSEKTAFKYPIVHKKIRDDKFLLKIFKHYPFWFFIWWLFADCGRSLKKWFFWCIGFSTFFGLIWYVLGKNYFIFQSGKDVSFFTYLYYSIVTFTTLGFGDVVPTKWLSELLVSIEVFIGYIMLGGLITIFANKIARRS